MYLFSPHPRPGEGGVVVMDTGGPYCRVPVMVVLKKDARSPLPSVGARAGHRGGGAMLNYSSSRFHKVTSRIRPVGCRILQSGGIKSELLYQEYYR